MDVVTTRPVLIYVKDKQAAFAEFHRVLRPGGRLSLFEPINRFGDDERETSFCGFEIAPVAHLAAKLHAVFDAIQPPDLDPMLDFDERDLIELAAGAGFQPVELALEAEVAPAEPMPWTQFSSAPGNPRIPSLAGAIEQGADERRGQALHRSPCPIGRGGRRHTPLRQGISARDEAGRVGSRRGRRDPLLPDLIEL